MSDSPTITFSESLKAKVLNALSEDYSPETVFWKIHPEGREFFGPSLTFYCPSISILNCLRALFPRAGWSLEVELSSGYTFESFETPINSTIQAFRIVETLKQCPDLELSPLPFD